MGDYVLYKHDKDPGTKHFLNHLRTDSFHISPEKGVKPVTVMCIRECAPAQKTRGFTCSSLAFHNKNAYREFT